MRKRDHEQITKGIRSALKTKDTTISKLRDDVYSVEELWVKSLDSYKALVELVNAIEDCANPEVKKMIDDFWTKHIMD